MARTSLLDQNPDLRQQFAEAYVDGATRADLAETFDVHKDTITNWTKDAKVQAIVTQLREERVNRITRKVDARLEAILNDPERLKKMSTKDILEIRRTLAPAAQTLNQNHSGVKPGDAEAAAWEALNKNPDAAAQIFGDALIAAAADDVE